MQKRLFVAQVLVVAAMLVLILPTLAQDSGFVPYQRLVLLAAETGREDFLSYGDIYSWVEGDTELFRETYYGYNSNLAMSPDGTKVVYLSLPEEFVNAFLSGNDLTLGNGPYPTNIWLMDLTIPVGDPARFVRIADQVMELPTDIEGAMQRRSMPVWSPDSTQIAWIELGYIETSFSGRVMIYDIATGTTQIAGEEVSMGYGDAGMWGVPVLVGWGSALANATYNGGIHPELEGGGFGMLLELFDSSGRLTNLPITYFANYEDEITDVRWVLHGDEWRLAMHYPNLGWVAMETAGYTYEQLANPPFVGAITGVGWTGQLVSPYPVQINWQSDQAVIDAAALGMPNTFSPEGAPVWKSVEWQLVTIAQGSVQPVLPFTVEGLAVVDADWTPLVWMTDGQGTPVESIVVPCCQ